MRIGILVLCLIAGLAGGPPASAAEDTGATQGSRTAPPDAAKEPAPPPSVTVIGAQGCPWHPRPRSSQRGE